MSIMRSLRGRLLVGVALWTLGVISVIGVGVTYMIATRQRHVLILHWGTTHFASVILLALVLLLAGVMYVRRGVSPITQLRDKLSQIHAGVSRRVDGEFPTEIEPLITDLNALLAHQ
jgi:methyl-accepting chemotaxis protein